MDRAYERAGKAREKGLDPKKEVEIPQAEDLAARVEKLVGPEGVTETIRELDGEMSREEIAFEIAERIVNEEFGRLPDEEIAEQAVRTFLAIITEGIAAAAPIEGITKIDIKTNFDGSKYLAIYFAGPIRSAGGTAAALAVLITDFVQRKLGLGPYRPNEEEVERAVEEVSIYDDMVGLQYSPSEKEVREAYAKIPVEVTGDPTESEKVNANKDLERVETDRVRGGAVLAIAEGVLQKAPKLRKHVESRDLEGWDWLEEVKGSEDDKGEGEDERKFPKGDKYLSDIIAGRPVFGYPGREGGFRLRYGRARNTGLAASGIHPATMRILNDQVSSGTQLKTERPGKATAISPVDSIEGPTVKLENGSVVNISSEVQAEELRDEVEEIISLGDILFGYGEFLENNHPLMPAGYCEEWWAKEVEEELPDDSLKEDITPFINPPYDEPSPELAVKISRKLGVPLHPKYTFNYHDIESEDLEDLGQLMSEGDIYFSENEVERIEIDNDEDLKIILEILEVPHEIVEGKIVLRKFAYPLLEVLGLRQDDSLSAEPLLEAVEEYPDSKPIEILENVSGLSIRKKAPTRIGARVGRPEKTKPRKMSPPVHALFPIGRAGGSTRNVEKASEKGKVEVEVAYCECSSCGAETVLRKCPECGSRTDIVRYCPNCDRPTESEECPACGNNTVFYKEKELDIESLLSKSLANLEEPIPDIVKGVKRMMSARKIPEPLEKGILRAKNDVYVFKDGTTRFDATDQPLTHFKPQEIGVSIEKLKELGYETDYKGNPLKSTDQVLELKVQDILLPPRAIDYLLKSSSFVDELLEKFYDLPSYYDAEEREDLIGELVIGLAPHTSAGITGRIIGFSEANVGYAHPYFHAAKRRNCDGDEDAVMLLMDALLNFSEHHLPETRGGRMDAPLVLTPKLDPSEIDDEAHNVDVERTYPKEFYEASLSYEDVKSLHEDIDVVEDRLGTDKEYRDISFTDHHSPSSISAGPSECRYKSLSSMVNKTDSQLTLACKIRAVDESDVAERLIENHFIPDLKGNLRAFSRQKFRCPNCNDKYRRVPLDGKCDNCGSDVILTVTQGGVEKYLKVASRVSENYGVSKYTKERLSLIEEEIVSLFEKDVKEQMSLADFA